MGGYHYYNFQQSGENTLYGDTGNDRLYGRGGENTLNGGDGDDVLYGGAFSDILDGGADNDLLRGGGGNDVLNGGSGADKFQMRQGAGDDIIVDFESGIDTLIFKGVNGVSSEADLAMVQTASGVEITYGVDAYSVLLIGVDISDLTSVDFGFA